jgi:hypothetical protein
LYRYCYQQAAFPGFEIRHFYNWEVLLFLLTHRPMDFCQEILLAGSLRVKSAVNW